MLNGTSTSANNNNRGVEGARSSSAPKEVTVNMSCIQGMAYQTLKSNSRRLLEWAKAARDQGNRADAAMFLQAASQMRREALQMR